MFSVFTACTAFLAYSCVYGFRKAFAVATFEGLVYLGIGYKVWLVIFQVIGYALSKFAGIKIVSELKSQSRFKGIIILSAVAGVSWFFFAIVPAPYNIIFLFTNGLPLGMVWGLIFSYLEGRQTTDLLGAGLSVSFIFSAGFSKTVGAWLMQTFGVSEWWMPFTASMVFGIPLLAFLWLLDQVPPPSIKDQQLRTARRPMDKTDRWNFVLMFGPALALLIVAYALLTAIRDYRDNFAAEMVASLGFGDQPGIYTSTEVPIAIIVLIAIGSMMIIKNNRVALFINLIMILIGFLFIGGGTFLFETGRISGLTWITVVGLGLYLGYVPFNCVLFERLIAAFRISGTVGFVMYLADAFGYLGSVGILFYKEFGQRNAGWLEFFISGSYIVSVVGVVMMALTMVYFDRKFKTQSRPRQLAAINA